MEPVPLVQPTKRQSTDLLIAIAFATLLITALPASAQGVAWPSIRASFHLSLDALGALLIAKMVGSLLTSLNSGRLITALGMGRSLAIGMAVYTGSIFGYVLAPAWWVIVLCGLVGGLGSGVVGASINTYFATRHGPSLMVWLHACFGLGSALGPAIATLLLAGGLPWRWIYGLIAVLFALLLAGYVLTREQWQISASVSTSAQADATQDGVVLAGSRDTLRVPAVWMGITLFFVFTGLQVTGGQWSYTLFTEGRSIAPAVAGMWVSIYWGSLTVGRILVGFAARYVQTVGLLRLALVGATVGAVLIWWHPSALLSFLGLALMGFAQAPMYPLSLSETPRRVGVRHAANAIGFQAAGATLGWSFVPSLVGKVAASQGLEVIGLFMVALTVLTIILREFYVRQKVGSA
jgi:fucose permease